MPEAIQGPRARPILTHPRFLYTSYAIRYMLRINHLRDFDRVRGLSNAQPECHPGGLAPDSAGTGSRNDC